MFSMGIYKNKLLTKRKTEREKLHKGSLTLEASLVMPLFLFLFLAFLYFIQIFTVQERIQSAITRMGLDLAKLSYIYEDFPSTEDANNFDQTILEVGAEIGISELIASSINGSMLKVYASNYLDIDQIKSSCIKDGFEGIHFYHSKVMDEQDCIDILVSYQIRIPVKLLPMNDLDVVQRVRLRGWTGYVVAPAYSIGDEEGIDEAIVFITKTGSVYHRSRECSHIKLSVRPVTGVPSELRNDHGAKYNPCELCCIGEGDVTKTYYITSNGTKYHGRNDCSKIKRTVFEVPLSEVSDRTPCKRCRNYK